MPKISMISYDFESQDHAASVCARFFRRKAADSLLEVPIHEPGLAGERLRVGVGAEDRACGGLYPVIHDPNWACRRSSRASYWAKST